MLNMYFKQNNIYFCHQCEFLVLYQVLGGPVCEFILGSSIIFHWSVQNVCSSASAMLHKYL